MHAHETVHAEPRGQIDSPTYRVNVWREPPLPYTSLQLDARVVTGAENIREVLSWAEDYARGCTYEVFVEIDDEPLHEFTRPRSVGLIRLFGDNPNTSW